MNLQNNDEIKRAAIERLSKDKPKGRHQEVIAVPVREALSDFCRQEIEFAQAVLDKDEGFDKCLDAVCKDVGNCLSDIEAYRRAVAFYFPGAGVHFTMRINLCASVDGSGDDGAPKSPNLQSAANPAGSPVEAVPDAKADKPPMLELSMDDLFA